MDPINDISKAKLYINIIYLVILALVVIVTYNVYTSLKISRTTSTKLIQTHTTQLNIEKFNSTLKEIKQKLDN